VKGEPGSFPDIKHRMKVSFWYEQLGLCWSTFCFFDKTPGERFILAHDFRGFR
jgi:hypothetical protein